MEYKCNVGLACNLCGDCVDSCSGNALSLKDDKLLFDADSCNYCETCMDVCPEYAIRIYEVKG